MASRVPYLLSKGERLGCDDAPGDPDCAERRCRIEQNALVATFRARIDGVVRLHRVLRILPYLLLAGCATAAGASMSASKADSSPLELAKVHGVPGESMEYELTLRGLPVGRVVVAVGELGWVDGRRAIIVRGRGQSAGLAALLAEMVWEMTTTVDMDRGYVIGSREETTITFNGETNRETQEIGDESAHDIMSAVGAVRAWRSVPAQRAKISIRFGSSSIDGTLVDASHEFLPSADRPAVKYTGTFKERFPFTGWISDDEARVPLEFECETPLGTVTAELVDYRAPRG
jgi:hypothetical protein